MHCPCTAGRFVARQLRPGTVKRDQGDFMNLASLL
jgi:hypothetical protein